jgi:4-amino-4-deoxy-L-arabinose transferase-like glycosyltransferase
MLPNRQRALLDQVHSDLSLRQLSRREGLALAAISLCAFLLLVALQHNRVFFGDEIGTLNYLKKSPGYILTHFTTHLSMNYFILVEKGVAWLCGAADWRLTLLPMAAAVAIIPLTASLALKFTGSTRTALIAASLAAFNPYLVVWGPAIRAYSLLVALSLLTIIEFFRWYRQRTWWSGARCAAVVLLLLLAHLNGAYTVAFLILLLGIETVSAGWSGGRKFLWESRTLWIPLAGAAVVVGAAYWHLLPGIAKVSREWGTDTPPTSMAYLPQV